MTTLAPSRIRRTGISTGIAAEVDRLARQIDSGGLGTIAPEVIDHLVAVARTSSASPVLTEVFADATAPAAVRERAFGRLAMQILATDSPRLSAAA